MAVREITYILLMFTTATDSRVKFAEQ